jgi:nicotinate-nucleotide adenylyltransferase
MLQAAIGDNLTFELSRVDMDRLGPHYTLDTINILRLEYPNDEIIYLIGGDSLHDLPNWHRALEFIEACDEIGVMRRPGDDVDLGHLEAALPGVKRKLRFVSAPLLEIASHQVRRRIAERRPYQYYLRPAVCDVIEKRGIYKAS